MVLFILCLFLLSAVEYNPMEEERVCDGFMEGAKVANLKKTDAFKFEYGAESGEQIFKLDEWMESSMQGKLREAIEQEIESKMNIGGIIQMKYVEVLSLDENQRIINYEVQIPYGQNEGVYDLRSKTTASQIQYHSSFRQFDVNNLNKS